MTNAAGSLLRSSNTSWALKGKLEDEDRNKYEQKPNITVNP
jgi:hypothetical protein